MKPDGYMLVKTPTGWLPEHRVVMEQMLGRQLLPHENVHHKNGRKDDNRMVNLELWLTRGSQPSGQRVSDLLEWARWLISEYDNTAATKIFAL